MKFDKTQQNMAYDRLINRIGPDLALYCMCAVMDVGFNANSEAESWEAYCAEQSGAVFADGETDVNVAIMAGMTKDERWATLWGAGYSESEYKQLDYYYNVMTSQLDATGGLDEQQKDAAISCAKMRLNKDKLLLDYKNKDSVSSAKQLDQMIRETLKDSNMRKADILPSAQQRPDGFVEALKKKCGLEMDMTKDDVMRAFYGWCRSKHYPQTIDAAEHELMLILQTMARNNDDAIPNELPESADFGEYEAEFEKEPNAQEEEVYAYRGYVRGEYKKKQDGEAK